MNRREWLALVAAAPLAAAETPSIDRFFDDFLRKWVMADPELASQLRIFSGVEQDQLDGQLNEISDEAAHARIARAKEGLAGLRQFDRSKLTPEQRLSAEMFQYQLTDIVNEEPYLIYNYPLNQMGGVQARLPTLLTDVHPMRTRQDAENYLARLGIAGPKIDQALKLTQQRAQQGVRLPGFIAVETMGQMRRFTAPDPAENILVTSFARRVKLIETIDPKQQADMVSRAHEMVRSSLYPAYHRAIDGLATENAKATEDAGLWRFPKGAEAYAFFLRRYTTTNMTADEIHQKGLDEVARIGADIKKARRWRNGRSCRTITPIPTAPTYGLRFWRTTRNFSIRITSSHSRCLTVARKRSASCSAFPSFKRLTRRRIIRGRRRTAHALGLSACPCAVPSFQNPACAI